MTTTAWTALDEVTKERVKKLAREKLASARSSHEEITALPRAVEELMGFPDGSDTHDEIVTGAMLQMFDENMRRAEKEVVPARREKYVQEAIALCNR